MHTRPSTLAHIHATGGTFRQGAAFLSDGTPIPQALFRRLMGRGLALIRCTPAAMRAAHDAGWPCAADGTIESTNRAARLLEKQPKA
jgi:hypothetical protein